MSPSDVAESTSISSIAVMMSSLLKLNDVNLSEGDFMLLVVSFFFSLSGSLKTEEYW